MRSQFLNGKETAHRTGGAYFDHVKGSFGPNKISELSPGSGCESFSSHYYWCALVTVKGTEKFLVLTKLVTLTDLKTTKCLDQ